MKTILDFKTNPKYQYYFDIIQANSPVSYGGIKLYNGKRDYLMQSPNEFTSTLLFLEDYFQSSFVNYLEIGTASNLTNSMIWNSLNIQENIIVDNLECTGTSESLIGNLTFKPNTTFIIGDSTHIKIQQKIKNLNYTYDLMLIDGNHDFEYITKDFEYYHKFLTEKGLLIFHDIDNDAVPGVRKFIKTNSILNKNFKCLAKFIHNNNNFNKTTFGTQCGIGVYQKK
jgi:hypothetical protein